MQSRGFISGLSYSMVHILSTLSECPPPLECPGFCIPFQCDYSQEHLLYILCMLKKC